jgi:hypothetical protein
VWLTAAAAPALEPDAITTAAEDEAAAPGAEDRWQLLESVADGFRAWLPGPTREEISLRQTIVGTVAEKKYFGQEDGRFFSVGFHMLPKLGKWFAPTSLVLSTAKKNVLSTNEGREISFERRDMNGHPGGVLTYSPLGDDESFEVMEVHMVLVGRRLYVLKASDPELGTGRASADRFFDSFEVIH